PIIVKGCGSAPTPVRPAKPSSRSTDSPSGWAACSRTRTWRDGDQLAHPARNPVLSLSAGLGLRAACLRDRQAPFNQTFGDDPDLRRRGGRTVPARAEKGLLAVGRRAVPCSLGDAATPAPGPFTRLEPALPFSRAAFPGDA